MIYFELKRKDDVLGTNLEKCPFDTFSFLPEMGKSRKLELNGVRYVLYADEHEDMQAIMVVEGDKDLFKSLKLRRSLLPVMENILHRTANFNVERAHDYAHSVNTLHGKMKQKIEEYADPEEFYGATYADVHERIKSKVLSGKGKFNKDA